MARFDRAKAALFSLVGAAQPRAAYMATYRGVVLSQSGQTVDVKMDDPRLPGMAALPVQVGLPGATVVIKAGARMLVAFENGDPAKPIALLWEGAAAARISLVADLVELGGEGLVPIQDGVVQGTAVDPLTGLQLWQLGSASPFVLAKKK